jgi:hypothetical protein
MRPKPMDGLGRRVEVPRGQALGVEAALDDCERLELSHRGRRLSQGAAARPPVNRTPVHRHAPIGGHAH